MTLVTRRPLAIDSKSQMQYDYFHKLSRPGINPDHGRSGLLHSCVLENGKTV